MAIYKEDIVDIDLNKGGIYRSFAPHAIGSGDDDADHFGVRIFRGDEPVNLSGVVVQGVFMPPQGDPIAITSGNIVSGNTAAVVLPQACYNYDGPFCLAIKLVSSGEGITGTVRIVDGIVDNTHTNGTVAPTESVPTYQEVLAVYDAAIEAMEGAVFADREQSLTDAQKAQARENIGAASDVSENSVRYDASQSLTTEQKAQARSNIGAADDTTVVKIESQSLTTAQKEQARANIGAADASKAVSIDSQSFTEAQQDQARSNINAANSTEVNGKIAAIAIPTPADRVVLGLKMDATAKNKYVYKQNNTGIVVETSKANVGYIVASLSSLQSGLSVYYNDIAGLATYLEAAVIYIADGSTAGSNVLIAATKDRIIANYYSFITWDSTSKTAIIDKAALIAEEPTAVAIFVDYYTATDIVKPVLYISNKSTDEKIDDLKDYTDERDYYPSKIFVPGDRLTDFVTGKYVYKRANDGTVQVGNDNSWSYKGVALSDAKDVALNLSDIDNYEQVVFLLADGEIGANVIITMTKTNVTTGTYSYMDYDPVNDRIVLDVDLLKQLYPAATHIYYNAYSNDYYCDVSYYSNRSTEEQLESMYRPNVRYVPGDKVMGATIGKYAYKRAGDGTVQTGNDNSWGYKGIRISAIGDYSALEFSDIDNYDKPVFLLADGGEIGSNVILMRTKEQITENTYSYLEYDSTNKRLIIKKSEVRAAYPSATHLFINIYGDDCYCKVKYYNEKTVDEQLEQLNESVDMAPEEYFKTEIENVKGEILAKSDAPCLTLAIVTDTHYNDNDTDNTRRTNETLNNVLAVNRGVFCDAVVHLGDIFGGANIDHTQEEVDEGLSYIQRGLSKANSRVYIVEGNHDGVNGMPALTQNYASLSKMNETYVVRNGDDPYFYVDIEKPKLRLIFLVTTRYYDIDGTLYNYWGLDAEQLQWFGETALDVDNGRDIIVFSHMGTYHQNFTHNKENTCGLCNAFNEHTTFDVYDGETLLFTADYTGKTLSKVLFWQCGHAHFDWIVPTSFSGLNFPQIVTTCSLMFQANVDETYAEAGADSPAREDRTVTQDAWDTLIYRPDEEKVHYVRFGAGSDRTVNLATWDTTQ